MRPLLVGLALAFLLPAAALAQVTGQVLKIGFDNTYRPDCWTPMLVQLTSVNPDSRDYRIDVVQEDLDGDKETFVTQDVVVPGRGEGQPPAVAEYWVYFRPKPTRGGLSDARLGGSLAELNDQLKVELCDQKGNQLAILPVTNTISSVDPPRSMGDTSRSHNFILVVSNGGDYPNGLDYSDVKGMLQDDDVVAVDPNNDDLPGDVRGYQGVDYIVWMDADARVLSEGTNRAFDAIREWVREGGHLVICEPDQPYKIASFADLLPVESDGTSNSFSLTMEPSTDLTVFENILRVSHESDAIFQWAAINPPPVMQVARARPVPNAVVDEWIEWPKPAAGLPMRTPWLARRPFGCGCVTWVAQNLGDRNLSGSRIEGWPVIWDRVFGWPNRTEGQSSDQTVAQQVEKEFPDADQQLDLGSQLFGMMNLPSKTAYLIGLAVFFFCVYWFLAGPGSYLLLAHRKKANLSWFVFALCAIAATFVTVLLVKLVVRGPPELSHLTVMRIPEDGSPAIAYSELGLYIPRDGPQELALAGTDPQPTSAGYITGYPQNPQFTQDQDQFAAYETYFIPVLDGTQPVVIQMPYRSTLKQLQDKWVGPAPGGIIPAAGSPPPALAPRAQRFLSGLLVNHLGVPLDNVFIAFSHARFDRAPGAAVPDSSDDKCFLIWINHWDKDKYLDLSKLATRSNSLNYGGDPQHVPSGDAQVVWAEMGDADYLGGGDWADYWFKELENDSNGDLSDINGPMMAFFHLLPPMMADQPDTKRFELFRRGGRMFDISSAVVAGGLVIVGSAQGPLPYPLQVNGQTVTGNGTTFYECVLPLDRSTLYPPSTQPAQ
ncbi:MAG TPA: hypothetical protein VMD30_02050 [Tepidisphaeraceae bacterium]|nr:hypothetical protein [Tepidisphaeraceae bacterium]